ncbi:uncharacterized protein LOC122858846 isoform X2 [Aphidius gifuensis]|uniref:uncharacterized protein LOC122858846 isoform X2 n=1 Tax=Aphidius gifuensis TaxID=684658 RepID=UPI001CDBCB8A|nr:uncharacterized protein LOC122858846 isoform X2 [Aphidius gifuensis]XP_044017978.1 uncharacterized protein LOC122858846 isoform X2 [Aphidius gifuensis]
MASQVAVRISEAHYLLFEPILKKMEVNSFFGILDLRVGAIIVAVIQLILTGALSYKEEWIFGTFYFIMGILLIIGAALDRKHWAVPWLVVTFLFEIFLIPFMIIDFLAIQPRILIENSFSFLFHLIGFSIVYSYYKTVHVVPIVVDDPV